NPKAPGANNTIAIEEIFIDGSNILWVCTRSGAILKYDRKTKGFMLYRHDPEVKDTISSNTILPIYEDRQGTIWIGTGDAGLNQYLRSSDSFVSYKFDQNDPASLPAPGVFAMAEDNKGSFWLSTSNTSKGTLCVFDRKAKKFIKFYRHDPNNPDSISNHRFILDIYPDRFNPDILWLAPAFGGLEKFDTKKEVFTHYPGNPDDSDKLSGSYVDIFQDDAGMLWLGGNYGLDLFDPSSKKVTRYRNVPDELNSLIENNVSVIYEDHTGILWLGTTGGLDKYNPGTHMFTHYTTKKGLPDNNILGILEDGRGNIWMSSGGGIIKFDPNKEEFKLYTKSDGLQGDAFYWFSDCRTKDGEMWFAGFNGANRFYPDKIKDNPHIPNIVLTSVKQGGEEMSSNIMPSRLKTIVLDWRANYFEFEAASLEFTAPEKNKYMYMLEGIDDKWFDAGNRRFGRYSNIPGGTYTLKLKGSNNDGVWNENGFAVQVIVANPPWKTWWAYTLYFIVTATLLFGFFKYNRMKVKKEEKIAHELRRSNKFLTQEILERKQAENALQKSEKRYRDLIERLRDAAYRMSLPDGKYEYVSRAAKNVFGYSSEQFLENPMLIQKIIHPDFIDYFKMKWTDLINGKIPETYEYKIIDPKGDERWIFQTNTGIFNDQDKIIAIEGLCRDITKKRRAESTLKENEKLLRTIAENYPHSYISIIESDYTVGFTSGQEFKTKDLDPKQFVGLELEQVFLDKTYFVKKYFDKTFKGEECNFELFVNNEYQLCHTVPLYAEDNTIPRILVVAENITEKKQLEKQIQQSQKMETIGTLAGGIAHDFNNILFPIVGHAEMLLEDIPNDSSLRDSLNEIFVSALRAKDLVKQILTFS
ncbi:MAG: PAS domain S-box protein, partial [Desulfobacteraceae bacterium]|nr:PAS domain S-box protein [Desulfobacteraceae bacterium]